MKVHIGSGTVYLRGWVNIDLPAPNTYLAADRPDLVELYGTDEAHYYARHNDHNTVCAFRSGPLDRPYLCDKYGDYTALPLESNSCTEVLARQSFEHLSWTEAAKALVEIERILVNDGILRIDVPDHDETVRLLRETGDTFYERHLYGSRRGSHGYHVMSYTRSALIGLAEGCGFEHVAEESNIHPYPAFCLRFRKASYASPRYYASPPYDLPEGWKVVDIGPGGFPHPRADAYIDADSDNLHRLRVGSTKQFIHKQFIHADIETGYGLGHIPKHYYDYAWCSHVLEHMDDPARAAFNIMHIAKRGTIVMPSAVKEGIFNFEEPTHKWLVLPHPRDPQKPIMIRRNSHYEPTIDTVVQQAMCRLFRTGPAYHEEAYYLRRWFRHAEPRLDVVVHWENLIELMVIE